MKQKLESVTVRLMPYLESQKLELKAVRLGLALTALYVLLSAGLFYFYQLEINASFYLGVAYMTAGLFVYWYTGIVYLRFKGAFQRLVQLEDQPDQEARQ